MEINEAIEVLRHIATANCGEYCLRKCSDECYQTFEAIETVEKALDIASTVILDTLETILKEPT